MNKCTDVKKELGGQIVNKPLKIAILTLMPNFNFGANMQAFALSQYLKTLGHEVFLLRRNIKHLQIPDDLINLDFIRRTQGYVGFEHKYFRYSDLAITADELSEATKNADLIITGSDQVWSKGFLDAKSLELFCLNFAKDKLAVVASYAASMGRSNVVEEAGDRDFFARNLDHFDYVSLRESGQEQGFEEALGFPCEIVLDPTLLLHAKQYEEFITERPVQEKYIFVHSEYNQNYQKDIVRLGKELSNKLGLPILNNCQGFGNRKNKVFDSPNQIKTGYHFSPDEVVNAIYHAEYVLTTSFHCLCFALNFKKNVYSVVFQSHKSNRQNHILGELGLTSQTIEIDGSFLNKTIKPITDEQWNFAHERLAYLRKHSYAYIDKITSGKKREKKDYLTGKNEFHCFSCFACADICHYNAIEMLENAHGFFFPKINKEKCTNCGACHKTCPYITNNPEIDFDGRAYLTYNLNAEELKNSSSGGMYPILARYVLAKNGFVIGVKFDDNFNVMYDIADNAEDAYSFRFSKYVYPLHNDIYNKTQNALKTGKLVLFTGSPCKIMGLRNFLGKDYENLLLVDIICHATASPFAFRKYLQAREKEEGSPIVKFAFRTPKLRQTSKAVEIVHKNGVVKLLERDLYMEAYMKELFSAKSCHLCPFTKPTRCSDFTIADFWGGFKYYDNPEKKPLSALLVNTGKASVLFDTIKSEMFAKEVKPRDVFRHNHRSAASISLKRADVLRDLVEDKDAIDVFSQNRNKATKKPVKTKKNFAKKLEIIHRSADWKIVKFLKIVKLVITR
ncbi:MAG: polysaccharide pyruvyl transferase family protein [Turicibacter sp.]|nr:polysaccharide pyruvyl transferase family protein [Turicibacter sp.]